MEKATDKIDISDVCETTVEPVVDISEKPLTKKAKTIIKNCKVLFWNKHSKNFAFDFDGKSIQITLDKPIDTMGDTVKIKYENCKYVMIE